jgi:hypothetical protein
LERRQLPAERALRLRLIDLLRATNVHTVIPFRKATIVNDSDDVWYGFPLRVFSSEKRSSSGYRARLGTGNCRDLAEAAVASRVLGTTCFAERDFAEALANLEEALRKYHLGHDLAAQALDC